jgi:hypothetical protein
MNEKKLQPPSGTATLSSRPPPSRHTYTSQPDSELATPHRFAAGPEPRERWPTVRVATHMAATTMATPSSLHKCTACRPSQRAVPEAAGTVLARPGPTLRPCSSTLATRCRASCFPVTFCELSCICARCGEAQMLDEMPG